jgi:hypothetical protein
MSEILKKSLKYIALGILVVPLSIITHELGHYLTYYLFGADNIRLHSVSVSADKETLSKIQIAVAAIVGPLITYLTIGLAMFLTHKKYSLFWVMLALAAPLGRIVNFAYLYFRLAGYTPNPNFDEFNFSKNLGIEPLFLSVLTICLVLAALFYFLRIAWKKGGFAETGLIILSLVIGVAVWMLTGGIILP